MKPEEHKPEAFAEIFGPDGKLHYTRPHKHPDVAEARRTPGYTVKVWMKNPDYGKATREVVFYAAGVATGPCEMCGNPTNNVMEESLFLCSFCMEESTKQFAELGKQA